MTANKTASKDAGPTLAGHPVDKDGWSGYGQAIVHLAWLRDGDQICHLLFGMVELRPCEFPRVHSSDEQQLLDGNGSPSCLHYRRFALSVACAIGWYGRSMDGHVRLPVDGDDHAGDGLCAGPFAGWPAWPTLAASNELDFAPDWARGSRAHFLHSRAALDARTLASVRRERNRRQLENWLHFDLVDLCNDYLGAICFVAPNPLFRSMEKSHLDTPNDGSAESIAYKLVARANQRVDGTRLEVVNEGLRGRLTPVAVEFDDDPVKLLEFTSQVNKEGRTVTHPRYGLLAWNEPIPLIRSIHTRMEVVSQRKEVEVPSGGKRKPAHQYSVSSLEHGGDAMIGRVHNDESIEARAIAATHRRAKKGTEGAERWFQDAPEDAAQFIRDTIGKARHRVLIADPYFAGRELLAFGHAIRRPDVELRVLTGKPDTDATTMLQAIETFQSYPVKPAIRVLKGKRTRLHDRFLVVDETVWFSGNSLNSLGERASMIVRLCHPELVVARLDGMWAIATPFAAWVAGPTDDA